MKRVSCDIETDGLKPTLIWCIVAKDIDTGELKVFPRPDKNGDDFLEYAGTVDCWVGHNFIAFDFLVVLRKFFPSLVINPRSIIDTLVCSRFFRYDVEGGHGQEAWGKRLGFTKPKIADWLNTDLETIINRCIEDVNGNVKLFKYLEKHIYADRYQQALRLEHDIAFVCEDMSNNGFAFNKDGAVTMLREVDLRLGQLDAEIAESFQPEVIIEEFIPKATMPKYGYVKGVPFQRITEVPFNPASPKQIVAKLNEAGWSPVNKTKGHILAERELAQCRAKRGTPARTQLEERLAEFRVSGWSIDEDNLSTLPSNAPAGARRLAERITLASIKSRLTEWLESYDEATGAIHGRFLHIGSWTHRMAHQKPNMANIPSKPDVKDRDHPTPVEAIKLRYSMPMRGLWKVRPGRRLVGVDADGIQLRILAHYMEDEDFIEALVNGKKEDKTDAHSLNAVKLGVGHAHRDRAKTFIYAWILGAGNDKVAEILQCSKGEARQAQDSFIEGYPGLKRLREVIIPRVARTGYFEGFDGRSVIVPSEHKVLAGFLQNGESVIMKTANIIWRTNLRKLRIPFWQVNFVHDEWQTETEDDDEIAALVEKYQCDSIREAGELYKLKCPLLGTGGSQGYTWAETH